MTVTVPRRFDWRWLRSPLAIALLLSVLLHLYVWLMAHLIGLAIRNGWLPAWMRPVVAPVAALVVPPPPAESPASPEPAWEEIPLQFVEVDPLAAAAETPPQTPYFSTANTLASNPDPPQVEQEKPRIDGERENTLKTFETTQPSKTPPPPAPREVVKAPEPEAAAPESPAPPVPPVPQPSPEPKAAAANPVALEEPLPPLPLPLPKPQEAQQLPREAPKPLEAPKNTSPGETEELQLAKVNPAPLDLAVPKPAEPAAPPVPQPAVTPAEPPKARRLKTLAEALAAKGAVVGERMRQEGGVRRQALQSSLNVKASPLGDYNYRMVLAVQDQWYRLLEERRYALDRQGQVVITFTLHSDGTITSINIKDSNVGEVLSFLCEMAVMQPAPFGKWPVEIRRLIGGDTVPVTFTFNYY